MRKQLKAQVVDNCSITVPVRTIKTKFKPAPEIRGSKASKDAKKAYKTERQQKRFEEQMAFHASVIGKI